MSCRRIICQLEDMIKDRPPNDVLQDSERKVFASLFVRPPCPKIFFTAMENSGGLYRVRTMTIRELKPLIGILNDTKSAFCIKFHIDEKALVGDYNQRTMIGVHGPIPPGLRIVAEPKTPIRAQDDSEIALSLYVLSSSSSSRGYADPCL